MLRRLAFITLVSLAAAALAFAPGVQWQAPEGTADRQVGARPAILGCIPWPAGPAADEVVPPTARCGELAHDFSWMDRIAITEC
jgi:hypothetical protein